MPIFTMSGENISKQTVNAQFSLDMLEKSNFLTVSVQGPPSVCTMLIRHWYSFLKYVFIRKTWI